MPLSASSPPSAAGISRSCRLPAPTAGNPSPSSGTARPVALAIAAISIADLVPSRNELNICGFIPAASASSAESP